MPIDEYVLPNEWEKTKVRLVALERERDPGTIDCFQAIGVTDGWQCLESAGASVR